MTIIDQKVREKLANFKLPEDRYASAYPTLGYKWADALLQSPDLRVTLVEPPEPRYTVEPDNSYFKVCDTGAVLVEHLSKVKAQSLADRLNENWLNSKEPHD